MTPRQTDSIGLRLKARAAPSGFKIRIAKRSNPFCVNRPSPCGKAVSLRDRGEGRQLVACRALASSRAATVSMSSPVTRGTIR